MEFFLRTVAWLLTGMVGCTFMSSPVWSQTGHRDTAFSYADGHIVIEAGPHGMVFESEFPTEGIEQQFATLPGFASEIDLGHGIGSGDQIIYHVLDDLIYWDGGLFAEPAEMVQIRVRNNPPTVPDTVIHSTSGEQLGGFLPPKNRIGKADAGGEFHVDLQWFLQPLGLPGELPLPPVGAYGVKLRLATSAAGIEDSPPFFYVFNFGLDEIPFQNGLLAFGDLLGSSLVLGDMDGDGDADFDDIDDFVLGLNDPAAYESQFAFPAALHGDTDQDGDLDFDDIAGFVSLLSGTKSTAVPEASAIGYALTGLAACVLNWLVFRRSMPS